MRTLITREQCAFSTTEQWIAKIESYNDWYLSEADFGVDEKKRPGKPKTQEDLFGVEGSFRKLEID